MGSVAGIRAGLTHLRTTAAAAGELLISEASRVRDLPARTEAGSVMSIADLRKVQDNPPRRLPLLRRLFCTTTPRTCGANTFPGQRPADEVAVLPGPLRGGSYCLPTA